MNTRDAVGTLIVRGPLFPTYGDLKHTIRAFDGEPIKRVRDMEAAISAHMGTPQNPVDWSDPDTWIEERLTGEVRKLAQKIWKTSKGTLNPRHVYGSYLFLNRMDLLSRVSGLYRLEERGKLFLADDPGILRELDIAEGLPKLLSLVAERTPCKRGDLLPVWSDYLKMVSPFSKPSTFTDTLSRRLLNLTERALVSRDGNTYSISDLGLEWLKGFNNSPETNGDVAIPSTKRMSVTEAARVHNQEQLKSLSARLMALEPAQFEHFVKELLEAMDYEDVQVTKISGDKGVDVVARIQFGITEITEVVQVKRTEGTITRPKIDELRGALPYHKAIRGTIISLGKFTTGAQEGALFTGAAPITLIDGKRLLDLCLKHQVGVKRQPVEIYEIDEAFFAEKFTREEVEGAEPLSGEAEEE